MTGQTDTPNRLLHEKRSATSWRRNAESHDTFAGLRASASRDRAVAFGQLASHYAAQFAAARQFHKGDALAAVLATLRSEQRAAERVLRLELAGIARARRIAILAAMRMQRAPPVRAYDALRELYRATRPAHPRRRFRLRPFDLTRT